MNAFDYFIGQSDKFDGATIVKDLVDIGELDLDAIEYVLSSAGTPAGITVLQARQYINFASTDAKVAYLHICEGASQLGDGSKDETTGKLISYLVTDFIKANTSI